MHPPSMLLLLGATSVAQATNQNKPRPRNVMPTAIKKMPPDQGAKFYPHYVAFPDTDNDDSRIFLAARSRTWHNISSLNLDQISPLAPFAPHLLRDISPNPLRRSLQERQWACPSDTHSCDAIGYPNSCCWEGTTCMVVPDTGLGPVGCCPEGARCGGGVDECGEGGTECPSELGGGCCFRGWECAGVGCKSQLSPSPHPPFFFLSLSFSFFFFSLSSLS